MPNEDNQREVKCDAKGCGRYFFIAGSCSITDEQLDAIGAVLGWTFIGEDDAYCSHCEPPKPKRKR